MNRVYETMVKYTLRGGFLWHRKFTLRVWCESERVPLHEAVKANQELRKYIFNMCACYRDLNRVIELIADYPGVAAVELLDHRGDGLLIYPDWK